MRRCRWCGDEIPARAGGGRRREFCDQLCHNRLHGRIRWLEVERGRVAAELEGSGLSPHKARRIEAIDTEVAELRTGPGPARAALTDACGYVLPVG